MTTSGKATAPPHDRPQAGIDAFESVFKPQLALLRTGWQRMWKKCL
jgi:hypothetical protein